MGVPEELVGVGLGVVGVDRFPDPGLAVGVPLLSVVEVVGEAASPQLASSIMTMRRPARPSPARRNR